MMHVTRPWGAKPLLSLQHRHSGAPSRSSYRCPPASCCSEPPQQPQPCIQRRHLLVFTAASSLLIALQRPQVATAYAESTLPKGYADFAGKLIGALQDAIDADLSDMEERQVRRKADPAKNLVKGWIQNWKDMMEVQQETSHKELSGVIRQLGDFYKKQGQRARMPRTFGEELLAKLSAAQNSLPLPESADGKQKA